VLGILAPGSVVTIRPEDAGADGDGVVAAVGGGFFAVADNRVSILAHEALLGSEVDVPAARTALDTALEELEAARGSGGGAEEPAGVRYLRAQLRAAGEPDARA
jgi:F-type H+-transporting ATPase subunit epsilon